LELDCSFVEVRVSIHLKVIDLFEHFKNGLILTLKNANVDGFNIYTHFKDGFRFRKGRLSELCDRSNRGGNISILVLRRHFAINGKQVVKLFEHVVLCKTNLLLHCIFGVAVDANVAEIDDFEQWLVSVF